ncbi:MAG TPA: DUF4446 family protein [Actinomycetota bacterium]|nr:DUF4446 family protein [Actinomycetota bacterium]
MPDLTPQQTTTALAAVAAVALLALLLAAFLWARLSKLRKNYLILRGDGEATEIFAVVGRSIKELQTLGESVRELKADHDLLAEVNRSAIQKFAMVRYDAFDDMGGRLSFSAALLDDRGDGIVITSINGRTETRTYAKPIKQTKSQHNLSQEEAAAIAAAMAGQGRSEALTSAAR